jgi:murein DD-endopeptidase MepM/ murein hydrolase activator NlpD
MRALGIAVVVAVLALGGAAVAGARADPADVAALQTAMRAVSLYGGPVDGLRGPGTIASVRAFQRRHGLVADGIAGPRTRAALGRRGRPAFGRRTMREGDRGWDVAGLQFLLARHGFPSGRFDGGFGPHVSAAVRLFQGFAGLTPDGIGGPATRAALRRPVVRSPLALIAPVRAAIGDRYGARADRWHTGLDYPAPTGTLVTAARSGRVQQAGWAPDGYGIRVLIAHGSGVQTLSAHLSLALVSAGAHVVAGAPIGRVGATGHATGPHLHFELLVRGARIDPLGALRDG